MSTSAPPRPAPGPAGDAGERPAVQLRPAASRPRFFGLSLTHLVATGFAALTAAVAGSFLGVTGTVAGAALASVLTAVGNAVFSTSLRRTGQSVRARVTQPQPPRGGVDPARLAGGSPYGEVRHYRVFSGSYRAQAHAEPGRRPPR